MEIIFLKAGKGDAILVKSSGQNMLVDGGDDTTYLFRELEKLYRIGECIDVLIVTHHDSDHIQGIIDLLLEVTDKRFGEPKDFIKRVYFNSPRLIKGIPSPEDVNLLSYKQASKVEQLIVNLGLNWDTLLVEGSESFSLGKATCTCLSPTEDIADGYANKEGDYLSSETRADWDKSFSYLEKYVSDKNKDKAKPNLSSIVLLLESDEKKILLTGDITPDRLEAIIDMLYENNGYSPVPIDFIKLPHHGSHRNITRKIISKVECSNYIISTDGNNHSLPDKKALLKVINNQPTEGNKISFFFNYSETIENLRISEIEKRNKKIELLPNNVENGISISTI